MKEWRVIVSSQVDEADGSIDVKAHAAMVDDHGNLILSSGGADPSDRVLIVRADHWFSVQEVPQAHK